VLIYLRGYLVKVIFGCHEHPHGLLLVSSWVSVAFIKVYPQLEAVLLDMRNLEDPSAFRRLQEQKVVLDGHVWFQLQPAHCPFDGNHLTFISKKFPSIQAEAVEQMGLFHLEYCLSGQMGFFEGPQI